MKYRLIIASVVLTCAACSVSRTTITHLQLRSQEHSENLQNDPVVVLNAVALPDYLLRDELLRRRGDYRLTYDPAYRWAEPLDLGIQRVLDEELEARLRTRQVIRFPAMARRTPDWILSVEVFSFEALDRTVVLEAEGLWSEGSAPETASVAIDFKDTQALDDDASADAIARALSLLLQRFALALAEELAAHERQNDG